MKKEKKTSSSASNSCKKLPRVPHSVFSFHRFFSHLLHVWLSTGKLAIMEVSFKGDNMSSGPVHNTTQFLYLLMLITIYWYFCAYICDSVFLSGTLHIIYFYIIS